MERTTSAGPMILATILIAVLAGFGSSAFHFLADPFGEAVFGLRLEEGGELSGG